MFRLGLATALALAISSFSISAQPASKAAPKQERTVQRFLHGTDADRDAILKEVLKVISDGGYRDVSMVPWFVMIAKNKKGTDVMLLVDPVTLMALELDSPASGREGEAASELSLPGLRN